MTISVGTPFTVASGTPSGLDLAMLTSTKAIAVYGDGDDAQKAKAIIIESDESVGSAVQYSSGSSTTRTFVVALSATKALAVYCSGGGATAARFRVLNISGTTITTPGAILVSSFTVDSGSRAIALVNLTSANSLFVYTASGVTKAVVISVSGSTITEESGGALSAWGAGNWDVIDLCALSSTKVLACYDETGSGNQGVATILNISAVTVSDGGVDTVFEAGHTNAISVIELSSSAAIVTYSDAGDSDKGNAQIITISGNTPTSNTSLIYESITAVTTTAVTPFSSSVATVISAGSDTITELNISGTTITKGNESAITTNDTDLAAITFDSTTILVGYPGSFKAAIVTFAVTTLLTLSIIPKPASVDASGEFIYLALLNNGTPILSKFSTALDADGTTVFNPGAGDVIGVECGRFNADVVWIAGLFAGTDQVEKSEDAGGTFTVKNVGFNNGGVFAFDIGPDSDEKVIVNNNDTQTLETLDDGETWIVRTTTNIEALSIDRLAKNTQETVFGNYGDANNSINYSINSGTDIADYQTGVFPNEDVTGVIVNG